MNYNWTPLVVIGIIAAAIIVANIMRRRIGFVRRGLVPTAVIAGFLLLILRSVGWLRIDVVFLEQLTYHGIAIGFIAMALRIQKPDSRAAKFIGAKSGALIVATYLIQALSGLAITIILFFTFIPKLFPAAGILLPMAFGQGPGQANNVGQSYELLGFVGGRSFGLALAASGYLCACIVGVVYLNVLAKKRGISRRDTDELASNTSLAFYEDKGEIPIAESIDKFSIQVALVILSYMIAYGLTLGVTSLLTRVAPGVASLVNSLLWGFNFIIGSVIAMGVRALLGFSYKHNIIRHQYQNSYLLSRIAGVSFDVMIVAGITSIEITELAGLWLPFTLLSLAGAATTYFYIRMVARKIYPDYFAEGFVSMYGMLTGTISSGVLLLREIDPDLSTPAANNLIAGTSYGIIFGAPLLIIINLAASSIPMLFVSVGIIAVYFYLLHRFVMRFDGVNKKGDSTKETSENTD